MFYSHDVPPLTHQLLDPDSGQLPLIRRLDQDRR